MKKVFWALFFDHSWLNLLKTTAEKQISEQALCSSSQVPHAVGWFSLPGFSSSPPQPPSLHPQFRVRKQSEHTEPRFTWVSVTRSLPVLLLWALFPWGSVPLRMHHTTTSLALCPAHLLLNVYSVTYSIAGPVKNWIISSPGLWIPGKMLQRTENILSFSRVLSVFWKEVKISHELSRFFSTHHHLPYR